MIYRIALLVTLIATLSGCAAKPPPAQPAANVALSVTDAPGLAQSLARHRGHVVLIDFWATWCGPCLALFPHTAELQRRYGDRGLIVITVSLDDPEERSAVNQFLGKHPTATENFLSSYGVGPAAFSAFDITDGTLPHVRIYDRDGQLRKTFASGGKPLDPDAIERSVREVLGAEDR